MTQTVVQELIIPDMAFYDAMESQAIQKANRIITILKSYFVERDDIIEALMIGLICKQHLITIGPPGTAKSYLTEAFCRCVEGFQYFKHQLTKYTIPEELFGPYSMAALKADQFERKTEDKLTEAHIVDLDEVFNGNSSILNALNSCMNERYFEKKDIPLQMLVGSTNFIADDPVLQAFFDRFLMRFLVERIHDGKNFKQMLCSGSFQIDAKDRLSMAEVTGLQAKLPGISIDSVIGVIHKLWKLLEKEGIEPSDRRFKWALGALKARALLNGRKEVTSEDLWILRDILWQDKKEQPIVQSVIARAVDPIVAQLKELLQKAQDQKQEIKNLDMKNSPSDILKITEALNKLQIIREEIEQIMEQNLVSAQVKAVAHKIVGDVEKIRLDTMQNKLGIKGVA
jgi:MoxR-like ATPase